MLGKRSPLSHPLYPLYRYFEEFWENAHKTLRKWLVMRKMDIFSLKGGNGHKVQHGIVSEMVDFQRTA